MAGPPLVAQGTLNRVLTSLTWQSFPALNVTPSFLGRNMIRLTFEGATTEYIPTTAGAVTSPNLYQMVRITVNLLKTQSLAQQYELQRQTQSTLGNCVVRGDSAVLGAYDVINASIANISELTFSGEDAGYMVEVRGYYLINQNVWT